MPNFRLIQPKVSLFKFEVELRFAIFNYISFPNFNQQFCPVLGQNYFRDSRVDCTKGENLAKWDSKFKEQEYPRELMLYLIFRVSECETEESS